MCDERLFQPQMIKLKSLGYDCSFFAPDTQASIPEMARDILALFYRTTIGSIAVMCKSVFRDKRIELNFRYVFFKYAYCSICYQMPVELDTTKFKLK